MRRSVSLSLLVNLVKTKKQTQNLIALLIAIVIMLSGYGLSESGIVNLSTDSTTEIGPNQSSMDDDTPDEALASSVLVDSVRSQLPADMVWNGAGAYVLNGNQTNLNADVSSQPYVDNKTKTVQGQTLPTVANALLSKATRQYKKRSQNQVDWEPAGWHQLYDLPGKYDHAVDRGHLIGYALAGNLKGFDASTSNPANIAVQTAWSNQADEAHSTGQNYYEGLVRRALDQNKRVRYRVTLIYADEDDAIAVGRQLEAKSSDGSLVFNVFVPNVQSGLSIDYHSGQVTMNK